jgi:predicted alpha/beta hydrolase
MASEPDVGVRCPMPDGDGEFQSFSLRASDGYELHARRYPALARPAGAKLPGRIVIAGATAVPQAFYRRFALFAVQRGYEVYSLDYRGIGASKPARLRGFHMNYLDWAQLDLAALVDAVPHQEGVPLFMVGHSYGGHAFGLLPNHERIAGFYTFATGAGWHGWMPRAEQWRVALMWRVLGPLLAAWKGYVPLSWLRMGEDLPLNAFRQWRHWCRYPNYFFDDPAMAATVARFREVRTPIVAANALDDAWAPPASRNAFMRGYTATALVFQDIDPAALGLRHIGHMGYFRREAQPLWEQVLDWFAQLRPQPQ